LSYLVLARKWRPQTFSDLVGQEHVSRTLKNAIDAGRVAHAFLFTGARGVGKTTSARILAKALNCEAGPTPEPCNTCTSCGEITSGTSVDVFEIDGASNTGVDDIRELRENVRYLPSRSRYKIFIIDEVHMLSTNAFNALLKTLEEPPPHVKFIFATTEPHKVPITILSRCQRFDFRRISLPDLVARLRYVVDQEGIAISDGALTLVARKGDGSMRDSLSLLDQLLACCGDQVPDADVAAVLGVVDRQLMLRVLTGVLERDAEALLRCVMDVDAAGLSLKQFIQELIDSFRSLLIFGSVRNVDGILDLSDGELDELAELSRRVDKGDIQRWLTMLLRAERDLVTSSFPRLVLEVALIRMATMPPSVPVGQLLEQLTNLARQDSNAQAPSHRPQKHPPQAASPQEGYRAGGGPPPPANHSSTSPVRPAPVQKVESVVIHPSGAGDISWSSLVEYIRGMKPMLAVSLELVHPLAVTAGRLEVGVRRGSFEETSLSMAENRDALQKLASSYLGVETSLQVTPLDGNNTAPPSLAEKKNLTIEERRRAIEQEARSHPAVVAALEIFSGAIEEIREAKEKTP
jgi:DNA polymerase-3 subunit gamma/tau